MRQRITNKLRSAAGVSFAEMLACTVLFSLAFMVGVSGLLFAFRSTEQVMQAADAQTVSDAILNRINGEIAGMPADEAGITGSKKYPVKMDKETNAGILSFTSASGIEVYLCSQSVRDSTTPDDENPAQLLIYYRETSTKDSDENATIIPASDWTFDKAAYQGYKITELSFTKGSHHDNLTITTTLTLESPTGKEYTTNRTVCCFNRKPNDVETDTVQNIIRGEPANPQQ